MHRRKEISRSTLVTSIALLSLLVVSLLVIGAVAPTHGRAAPSEILTHSPNAHSVEQATTAISGTVFLPFVISEEETPNIWTGEYYDNASLEGSPDYTQEDARIDFDWDEDAPDGLSNNYFSIRWTGNWEFEVGVYTFFAYSDDGMRLWLDGELVIDAWSAGMGSHDETVTVDRAGSHRVVVEYFERTGDAEIQIHWRRTDLFPVWPGDYYNNPWVEGGKLYSETDRSIQFDWGEGCPSSLSCNAFSISWEARPLFETGTNRILMYSDEGYRLDIDGNEVQDAGWYSSEGTAEDDWYDLEVDGVEYHRITYDFHDQGGVAEARLWWVNLEHPYWYGEYYDNTSLSGDPIATKEEPAVFYDWGLGRPGTNPRLPSRDNFSVRWTGQRYFHSGFYRFYLFADDGARLWVDGELLISAFRPGRGKHESELTFLTSGYHDVVIEYVEHTGEAEIRFWYE